MVITNNAKSKRKNPKIKADNPEHIHAHLISKTPGRIRLRVVEDHRHSHKITPVVQALQDRLEIYRVRSHIKNGSLTLFHAQEHSNFEDVSAILRDLGVIVHDLTEESPLIPEGKSEAASEVAKAVFDLNQRVKKATKGAVDLRFLLPLSFATLSVRQLLFKGLQLEIIPWYVLAWYAFDSFIKLHYTKDPEQE
jgi:hypothetical protein